MLSKKFVSLLVLVKSNMEEQVEANPKLLSELNVWTEQHVQLGTEQHVQLGSVQSLYEYFHRIHPHYDFLECDLVVNLCQAFLNDVTIGKKNTTLLCEVQQYQIEVLRFRCSAHVRELDETLRKVYEKHLSDISSMPHIYLNLQLPWITYTIDLLVNLIIYLLPNEIRQSVLKYMRIIPG